MVILIMEVLEEETFNNSTTKAVFGNREHKITFYLGRRDRTGPLNNAIYFMVPREQVHFLRLGSASATNKA